MAEEKKEEQTSEEEVKEEKTTAEGETSDKKEVEVPEKFKSLVESIEGLTALELSELVKVLEDKFGVSAAAPVAVAAAGGAVEGGAEEKDEFNVELADAGSNKIAVIKVVREITGKGLKDAKDLVDGAPAMIKESAPKAEAEDIKAKIEEAGGKVNLK